MDCAKRSAQTFVGLDVHKKQIVGALLLPSDEIREIRCQNTVRGLAKLVKWMGKQSEGDYECCYEAGFCGYALARALRASGVVCRVIAPSLAPVTPGDRVKTDRRDARKLAEYLRARLLKEVAAPSDEDEALRDLCRNREDARQDLHRARQRLIKFLDRKGWAYHEGSHWTEKHRSWLNGIRFPQALTQYAYEDCRAEVERLESRLRELDGLLHEVAHSEAYREVVGYLCCFRGIDWLSAILLVSELFDPGRFPSARKLMAYVGLTPSEESSGEKERRKGLTGGGNRVVRRLVIEIAWNQRWRRQVGKTLGKRREGQPKEVVAYADKALDRLSRRYWRLLHKGKQENVVVVAVARELVGYLWGLLCSGEFLEPGGSREELERAA